MLLWLSVCNWFLEVLLWWVFQCVFFIFPLIMVHGAFCICGLIFLISFGKLLVTVSIVIAFFSSFWDSNYMYISSFIRISCATWTVFWILNFFLSVLLFGCFLLYFFLFRKSLWTISNLLLNSTIVFLFQLLYFHVILSHRFQISNKILHL